MRQFTSYRVLALIVLICSVSYGAYLGSLSFFQNQISAGLIGFFTATNLILMSVLVRVLLVERSPKWRNRLEKLPLVSFIVPVPDQLRSSIVKDKPMLKKATPEVVLSPEPFTLGTVAFEPPEPIAPAEPPVLAEEVMRESVEQSAFPSIENAFRKAERPIKTHKQRQQAVFTEVCLKLKQANEEVAVWTEGELATLANSMLDDSSEVHDMIALLLPQRVLRINVNRTFEFEHHAQVLNNIVLATGCDLPVRFVNSSKDNAVGGCVVNFEYGGKPVTWRFMEREDRLSEKFLSNALNWVSARANGEFVSIVDSDSLKTFVFVSKKISQQVAGIPKLAQSA
jgi:hypothetical protein